MNPASFALSPDGKYIAIVTQAEINVLSLAVGLFNSMHIFELLF